jgi:hypothetical protein
VTASRRTDGTRTTLFLVFVLAAAAVAILQPNLAAAMKNVKATEDVYVLPPPEELKVATLGYSSASADMIWAQLLVEYGRHWAEKRPFPDLEKYLDAIIALDPSFSSVYRFVDTLLIFRPPRGTEEDARKARAYLERGLRERPYDKDVWLQYGQFVGFLAPSFLTAEDEKERWRIEGAEALIRAVELGAVLDRAISATSMLSRRGRRQAAVEYLERARALTDDPASIAEIEARLSLLERDLVKDDASVARMVQRREVRNRLIDGRWRGELPFVSRGEFLLLGPLPNAFVCSGNDRRTRADCAPDWTAALNTLAP